MSEALLIMNSNSAHIKVFISALAIFALTLGVEGTHGAKRSEQTKRVDVPNLSATDFPPITIVAFGDLMLDRFVWTLMQRNGLDYPFEYFTELLSSMGVAPESAPDFLFANLEGPVSDTPYVNPGTAMVFNFRPDVIPILQKYGFNLFSIANNHAYDMGEKGVRQTRERLSEAGIHWVGESKGIARESQWTTTVKSTTLTFFAFNDTLRDRLDFDQAATLIRAAEKGRENKEGADFTIVSIHWGVEYNQTPTQKQVENAHKLVDAGADIILGHHPHVIQSHEWYTGPDGPRPIYYSLGNFIFDQYFSKAVQEGLGLTLTLQKSTDPKLPDTITVKETVFDIMRSQVQPRPPSPSPNPGA